MSEKQQSTDIPYFLKKKDMDSFGLIFVNLLHKDIQLDLIFKKKPEDLNDKDRAYLFRAKLQAELLSEISAWEEINDLNNIQEPYEEIEYLADLMEKHGEVVDKLKNKLLPFSINSGPIIKSLQILIESKLELESGEIGVLSRDDDSIVDYSSFADLERKSWWPKAKEYLSEESPDFMGLYNGKRIRATAFSRIGS